MTPAGICRSACSKPALYSWSIKHVFKTYYLLAARLLIDRDFI